MVTWNFRILLKDKKYWISRYFQIIWNTKTLIAGKSKFTYSWPLITEALKGKFASVNKKCCVLPGKECVSNGYEMDS